MFKKIFKIKYRIKKTEKVFYLQKKFLLFWRNIEVKVWDSYWNCPDGKKLLCFDNLDVAKKEIDNYRNNYLRPFFCLKHIIKTYYGNDGLYYYADPHHYRDKIYSTSSEKVCELILEYEESKKPIIYNIDYEE